MKFYAILLSILTNVCLYSQTKGVSIQTINNQQLATKTYAVVVGISDYQDPAIPDLRFADKDAEAFAEYLRRNGSGINPEHLILLTNENATAGKVAAAFDGLIEQAKADDQVIIYFSGHGDVERKTVSQPGFLLCWDAPAKVYMGGGTYSLAYLQEIVTTLSTINQSKVIVISDACHAGKLAGNQIGGAQLTSANLAKQFSNEIKILSCQPGEFSLEGEQWGGGRGCFSYHLINGLYGLADLNKDHIVTLGEIDRYLENHVTKEVAPLTQVPMTMGSKLEQIAQVSTLTLEEFLKNNKTENSILFAATDGRGFEDAILDKLDSNVNKIYRAFQLAIKEKRFFEPEHDCAEKYYEILTHNPSLAPMFGLMKRNYAAALQDDAQQTLNKFMGVEIKELSLSRKAKVIKYKWYPKQLERAAELLGEKHYLYSALMARRYYFEGFPYAFGGDFSKGATDKAIHYFKESLGWQQEMPNSLLGLQSCYANYYLRMDSAEYYAYKAREIAPAWVLPFVRMAETYAEGLGDLENSWKFIKLAEEIDSASVFISEAKSFYYYIKKDYRAAEIEINKILSNESSPACLPCTRSLLVDTYLGMGQLNEAEKIARELVLVDSSNATYLESYGRILVKLGKRAEANLYFKKYAELTSLYSNPDAVYMYYMAYADALEGFIDKAFDTLEKALALGYDDYAWMQTYQDMQVMRAHTEKWNTLMRKYFPEKHK